MKTPMVILSLSIVCLTAGSAANAGNAATPTASSHGLEFTTELEGEVDAALTTVTPAQADCIQAYYRAIDTELQSADLREPRRKALLVNVTLRVQNADSPQDQIKIEEGTLFLTTSAARLTGEKCVKDIRSALIGGFVEWDLEATVSDFEDLELVDTPAESAAEPATVPATESAPAITSTTTK
jgi:hypothetical protein